MVFNNDYGDDISYSAVASAFHLPLQLHNPTLDAMKNAGMELNESRKRMALFPSGDCVTVHAVPGLWVPIVQIHSVFMFPGIPRLFKPMAHYLLDSIIPPSEKLTTFTITTKKSEGDIAVILEQVEREMGVEVGSYPKDNLDWKVEVVVKGKGENVKLAALKICEGIQGAFKNE